MSSPIHIVAARRTAIGTFCGSFSDVPAVDLGAVVIKAALADAGLAPAQVNEVILGNVLSAGLGQNVARQVTLKAGLPVETPATTVNLVCGSGIKSIQLGFQSIATGYAECVVVGGAENMTRSPYVSRDTRLGKRMGNAELVDSMIHDGLWCASNNFHMGITAENVAKQFGISREEQDAFAFKSQTLAANAISAGAFAKEIVPVTVKQGRNEVAFATDEHPRATSPEKLAGLKPAFDKAGSVTAGNASGINDGAAILVLASDDKVKRDKLTSRATIRAFGVSGLNPAIMGMGPVEAVRACLKRAGLTVADIHLWELNEAFASQAVACVRELGIHPDLVNVNGGAIALGHPIGASGARIVVSLLHAMEARDAKRGVASLCIGGGMGIAILIERA